MVEQLVIDKRMLVTVCDLLLAVTNVTVLPGGHLLISVEPPVVIVPGKPIGELLPLEKHQDEVRGIVSRAMNVGIKPTSIS
jgi:hypothetical protein